VCTAVCPTGRPLILPDRRAAAYSGIRSRRQLRHRRLGAEPLDQVRRELRATPSCIEQFFKEPSRVWILSAR